MAEHEPAADPWRFPLLLLWQLVFLIGLVPETVFFVLRRAASVSTFAAMVNSPAMITLSLACYVALFVWRRCREWGVSIGDAAGKSFQFGIFATMAFMVGSFRWDEPGILVLLWHIREVPIFFFQAVVFAMAFAKLTAWLYLLIIFFRYYALGQERVFVETASIFPSAYVHREPEPAEHSALEDPDAPQDAPTAPTGASDSDRAAPRTFG